MFSPSVKKCVYRKKISSDIKYLIALILINNIFTHTTRTKTNIKDQIISEWRINFLLVTSYQSLVSCYQSLVSCYQSLFTNYQSLVASYQSLVNSYQSLVTCYWSLLTSHQVLVTSYQLSINSYYCSLVSSQRLLMKSLFSSYFK